MGNPAPLMAMPETAMHENNLLAAWKNNVG
jgi:hypothetical protein